MCHIMRHESIYIHIYMYFRSARPSISHLIGRPPGGEVFVSACTTVGLTTVSAVGLLLRLLSVSPAGRRGGVRRTVAPVSSRAPPTRPTTLLMTTAVSSPPPLLTAVAGRSGAAVASLLGAGVTATTTTASGPLPRVRTIRGHCIYYGMLLGVRFALFDCGCFYSLLWLSVRRYDIVCSTTVDILFFSRTKKR